LETYTAKNLYMPNRIVKGKIMLVLCFLLQYVAASSKECSSDRASGIDAGTHSGATGDVFGEANELSMLQITSHQRHGVEKARLEPVQWQCHEYTHGQGQFHGKGDEWCNSTAIQGGFEYSYNGGKFNQCGGCWCCKREIPMAEHAWLLAVAKDMPLTKEIQTEVQDNTPAWSCHLYSHGQNDDWCKESTIEGRFSYAYAGGESNQCGGCYCCRREIPKSDLVRVLAEAEELSIPHNGVLAELSGKDTRWECHLYTKGQNDEWCSRTAIEDGYEISYTGGRFDQCGGCYCCERKIPVIQRAQLLLAGSGQDVYEAGGSRVVPAGLDPSEVVPIRSGGSDPSRLAWQCHLYAKGETDAWCMKATIVDGIEYSYTGGRFDQCGGCYCCKREIPKYQIANFFASKKDALLQQETANVEVHHEETLEHKPWQCHKYSPGQTDAWCKSRTFEGGYEYSYNSGECGDCFCCRRQVPEAKQAQLLALARDVQLTADLQMRLDKGPTAWSCHKYTQGQTNFWCQTAMIEDGVSYSYTGGDFDQCGGCWCCKREVSESALVRVLAEADDELPLAGTAQLNEESPAWQCHKYAKGQSDAWCIKATIADGYEFSFNGGNFDQCGGCSCCSRQIPRKQQAQMLIAGREQTFAKFDEPTQPWQCHAYAPGQTDAWCSKATIVGDFQYSFNGGKFDQCGGCYCCKRQIPKYQLTSFFLMGKDSFSRSTLGEQQSLTVAATPSVLYEFPEPNAWRCHQYEPGQSDAWCQAVTIEGGWEYSYSGGEQGQCGGCFCCRREVPQAQQKNLRASANELSLTANLQEQLREQAPSWMCHAYTSGQNHGWCRRGVNGWVRIEAGFSYSYTGGAFNQCGGCFCCKRKIPEAALVKMLAGSELAQAAELPALPTAQFNEQAPAWQCHKYTKGQTDAWCQSTTIAEGHEFSYNGGNFDQCGGCFCCSRPIPKIQQAQLLIAGKDLPRTPESYDDEPTPAWQCHAYAKGQTDDWCNRATIVDGFQYSFNGGKFHQCGGCYCCKREIPRSQLARFFSLPADFNS